jgi:hypothetical protein
MCTKINKKKNIFLKFRAMQPSDGKQMMIEIFICSGKNGSSDTTFGAVKPTF